MLERCGEHFASEAAGAKVTRLFQKPHAWGSEVYQFDLARTKLSVHKLTLIVDPDLPRLDLSIVGQAVPTLFLGSP